MVCQDVWPNKRRHCCCLDAQADQARDFYCNPTSADFDCGTQLQNKLSRQCSVQRASSFATTQSGRFLNPTHMDFLWLTVPMCMFPQPNWDFDGVNQCRNQYANRNILFPVGSFTLLTSKAGAYLVDYGNEPRLAKRHV